MKEPIDDDEDDTTTVQMITDLRSAAGYIRETDMPEHIAELLDEAADEMERWDAEQKAQPDG